MMSKVFLNSKDATVWAIDDAWFSKSGAGPSLESIFSGALSTSETLDELLMVIKGNPTNNRNASYLKALVEFCLSHGLRLGLGSFEHLQRDFARINSQRSAILLDVHYEIEGEDPLLSRIYGVHLLHQLLGGEFPKAEIFFVTAYPENVQTEFDERAEDKTWWPLLGLRVLNKRDPKFKSLLKPFFENFAGRVDKEDRFRELARAFIDERRKGDEHTHPEDIEELKNKHQKLCLLDSFIRAEEKRTDSGVSSYSALYHNSVAGQLQIKRGAYPISTQVFSDHCDYLGVKVDVTNERDFILPIQPGLVFLLCFCRFVSSLKSPAQPLTLSFTRESDEDWAILSIRLDSNIAFQASVLGSEELGRATKWFKRTLRGEGRFVLGLAGYEETGHVPWSESIPIKKGKIYPLIVTPVLTAEGSELRWKC